MSQPATNHEYTTTGHTPIGADGRCPACESNARLANAPTAWQIGDRVLCNGHEGAIGRLESGVMAGMATVRMMRGQVTVSLSELVRAKDGAK
jgi:hypothetical protein